MTKDSLHDADKERLGPRRFDGLTAAQERTLGWIATMGGQPYHPKVIAELLRRGLIVEREVEIGRDRFGPIIVKDYEMPLREHIRWCRWCADHPETPDEFHFHSESR